MAHWNRGTCIVCRRNDAEEINDAIRSLGEGDTKAAIYRQYDIPHTTLDTHMYKCLGIKRPKDRRECPVCIHEKKGEIDALLNSNASMRLVAHMYSVPYFRIRNHRYRHLDLPLIRTNNGQCHVCRHELASEIEMHLIGRKACAWVARMYNISVSSVERHNRRHLTKTLQVARQEMMEAVAAADAAQRKATANLRAYMARPEVTKGPDAEQTIEATILILEKSKREAEKDIAQLEDMLSKAKQRHGRTELAIGEAHRARVELLRRSMAAD